MHSKSKRIGALIGILFLIILYGISFILGVFGSSKTFPMFMASLLATFFIPTTIFAYQLFYKVLKKDEKNVFDEGSNGEEDK